MKERLLQLKSYGFWRLIRIGVSFLRTWLFYRPVLFIFFPLDIRGKRSIKLGEKMTCGTGCRFEAYPKAAGKKALIFGKNIQINDYVHITAVNNVRIGDNVLMASRIYISDAQHGDYSNIDFSRQSAPECIAKDRELSNKDVNIEDNVWIGEGACIMPGVTVGRCSIIGANAVVTRDVPEYCIAAGSPAHVIKRYNQQQRCWERCES